MSKLFLKTRLIKQVKKNTKRKSSQNNISIQLAKTETEKQMLLDERKKIYADFINQTKGIKDNARVRIIANPLIILRIKGRNIVANKTLTKLENQRKKIISDFEDERIQTTDFLRKLSDKIMEYKNDLRIAKEQNKSNHEIESILEKIDANKKLITGNQEQLKELRQEYHKNLDGFDNNVSIILDRLKKYDFRKGIYKKK